MDLIRLKSAPDYDPPPPPTPYCMACDWSGDWTELKTEKEWDDMIERDVPVCPICNGYEIEW